MGYSGAQGEHWFMKKTWSWKSSVRLPLILWAKSLNTSPGSDGKPHRNLLGLFIYFWIVDILFNASICQSFVIWPYTQKNVGTQKSIFVCCTEDIYKFVSRSYLFECSPCGSRPGSTVTWKYLFVTAPIASFWGGGGGFRILNVKYFNFLSHIKTLEIKLKWRVCKVRLLIRRH